MWDADVGSVEAVGEAHPRQVLVGATAGLVEVLSQPDDPQYTTPGRDEPPVSRFRPGVHRSCAVGVGGQLDVSSPDRGAGVW